MKSILYLSIILAGFTSCASSSKILPYGALDTDKSLFYYHTGKGDPIIFVHGGPGLNHRYFLLYLERLADSNHLIFYDQRACGDSEIPVDTNKMSIAEFVNDITRIKEKFKLKKFHLLAHSWGATVALRYAMEHSDQLLSLILVNPAAISSADTKEASKLLSSRFDFSDQSKRSEILESSAFKQGEPSAYVELFKLAFSKNMSIPSQVDSLNIYLPMDYLKKNAALRYLFKDLNDYDLYPQLNKISCPVLTISGDKDIGVTFIDKIKKELPNGRYEIIKESGHFPFLEQPKKFDQIVKEFIDKFKK